MEALLKLFQGCGFNCTSADNVASAGSAFFPENPNSAHTKGNIMQAAMPSSPDFQGNRKNQMEAGGGSFSKGRQMPSSKVLNQQDSKRGSKKDVKLNESQDILRQMENEHIQQRSKRINADGQLVIQDSGVNLQDQQDKQKLMGILSGRNKGGASAAVSQLQNPLYQKESFGPGAPCPGGSGIKNTDAAKAADPSQQFGAVASVAKDIPCNAQNNTIRGSDSIQNQSHQAKKEGKYNHVWLMNDASNQNKKFVQGSPPQSQNENVSKQKVEEVKLPEPVNTGQVEKNFEKKASKAGSIDTSKPDQNMGKLQLMEMKRRQGTTNQLYGGAGAKVDQVKNNLRKMALF